MSALPRPCPAKRPARPQKPRPLAALAWAGRPMPTLLPPERGVVLLVALVMLLLVTVLGLASVRMLTLEERMAANSFDRNLAFQAAESALREGEALAELQLQAANGPNAGIPSLAMVCNNLNNGACAGGLCSPPHGDCTAARWEDSAFAGWRNASAASSPLAAGRPQFFVEHLGSTFPCDPQNPTQGPTCARYRITARSHDPAAPATQGRANVVLQSIYAGWSGWVAAQPPVRFTPETFAPTDAAQNAGKNPSRPDSNRNGPETENDSLNDDVDDVDDVDPADNANIVRGRISWREIIPR